MNLIDLFEIPRRRSPDKPAVEARDAAGRAVTLSYEELHAASERLAARLRRWGLRPGDRAAFFAANSAEFAVAYLAVLRCGAAMLPINLRYRKREIAHILADGSPRLLVADRAQAAVLDEVDAAGRRSVEGVLWLDEPDAGVQNDPGAPPTVEACYCKPATPPIVEACYCKPVTPPTVEACYCKPVTPPIVEACYCKPAPGTFCAAQGDDLALLMYTSGTTGRSKGAMLSHNNVLATVTALLAAWAWQPEDRLLLCLPLFHTHGLVVGLHCALAAGATVLLRPKYEARATLDELAGGAATLFFGVPTLYARLVDELRSRGGADLRHMRLFCSGSAPLSAETFRAFEELAGHAILERYGMTETGMNLSNPYAGPRPAGTVGTPLPGVSIRIVDAAMADVAPGETGGLLVRGGNVFSRYWNAPEKTAESFVQDELGRRWFITGDLARQDPATGYVTLLGRSHDLIISGGFNIYPREIEELLESFPGVAEAAVVGEPHAEWGEAPAAYLVCTAAVDDAALAAFCRAQLAAYKTPQRFTRVESLPRNAMGKVQKHLLPR